MKSCPQCNTLNAADFVFCTNCGYSAPAGRTAAPLPPVKKSKILVPLLVLGAVLGLCGLCGVGVYVSNYFDAGKFNTSERGEKSEPLPKPAATAKSNVKIPISISTPITATSPWATPSATPAPAATLSEAGVTLANFNRVKNGMSYQQVVEILGEKNKILSENEFAGKTFVMYQWEVDKFRSVNAIFQNDKLLSKAQIGLK